MGKVKKIISWLVIVTLISSILPSVSIAEVNPVQTSSTESKQVDIPEWTGETNVKPGSNSTNDNIPVAPFVTDEEPPIGEILSKRTENTKVFYEGNGKYKKQIYFEPIHKKGTTRHSNWENLSPALTDLPDTTVAKTENALLTSVFKKQMENGEYATFSIGNRNITYSLVEAFGEKESIPVTNSKATFVRKQNRIVHPNVFPNIDLRNLTFDQNIKEDLVLRSYEGYHSFVFNLKTDLIAEKKEDGSILFHPQGSDEKIFELPKPFMADSNYNELSGEVAESDKVTYELEKIEGGYKLLVQADPTWLKAPERVYPVYIDPSTSINAATDAFVMSAYPTTNYSSATSKWDSGQNQYVLKVGTYDSTTGTNYAFMNHDLSSVENMNVTGATLNVFVAHSYLTTANGLWLDSVNSSWSPSTLTWNNKPASTNIDSVNAVRDQWAQFDVTNTVKAWVGGTQPNYGFKFHTNGNGQTFWKKIVSSTNSTNKPYISINYTIPRPETPEGIAYSNGDGTGYINLSWKKVTGATSYKVWIYNGASYESFSVGNVDTWSTSNKKIWPKTGYDLNNTGSTDTSKYGELVVDPSPTYQASGGIYPTRKNYWFRVSAVFDQGESSTSEAFMPTIPNLEVPKIQSGKTFTRGTGTGYIDFTWNKVGGATKYKIWIFNGLAYESYLFDNPDPNLETFSWTTKDKKYWATPGSYQLHMNDSKSGTELPIDPSPTYALAAEKYKNDPRFYIRVSAINGYGETITSPAYVSEISSLSLPNAPKGDAYRNYESSDKGYLDLTWDQIAGATGYKIWMFNGKAYEEVADVGNNLSWSTKGKGIWPTETEIAQASPLNPILHKDGNGLDLPSEPHKLYEKMGTSYATSPNYFFRVSAYDSKGETVFSNAPFYSSLLPRVKNLGTEDYWTFDSYPIANGNSSVNVLTGNHYMSVTDLSILGRGNFNLQFQRLYNSTNQDVSSLGKGWSFTGNESISKITSSEDVVYKEADGTELYFPYNQSEGKFIPQAGSYLTLTKTENGYSVEDKYGNKKLFGYLPNQAQTYKAVLISEQDRRGNENTFSYDSSNKLEKITNSLGKSITLSYYPEEQPESSKKLSNKLMSVEFEGVPGEKYTYTYHSSDYDLLQSVNREGDPTDIIEYQYNLYGDLMTIKDQKNRLTDYTYENHKVAKVQLPDSSKDTDEAIRPGTVYSYNTNEKVTTVMDPLNFETKYYTEDLHVVNKVVDAVGSESIYHLDDNFNVEQEIENGQTTAYTYDNNGNVETIIDPEGNAQTYTYTHFSNVKTHTDSNQNVTSYFYNSNGDLDFIETPDPKVQGGKLITDYDFNVYGDLNSIQHPDGTKEETVIDYLNSEKEIKNTDAFGNITSTTFDLKGNILKTKDGKGYLYDYKNTVKNQLESVTDPKAGITVYKYDSNGNIESIQNAKNFTSNYLYNGLNLLKEETNAIGKRTTYEYDSAGNLKFITLPSGNKLQQAYDQINRLTHIYTGTQPILKWRYEYSLDKLSKIYRGTTLSKSFTYYNNDFLKTISENGNLLEYTYKGEEYTSQVKYTVGTNPSIMLDYVPDNLYRTVEVKRNGQLQSSIDYHENGLPKKIAHLNGSSVGMEYTKGRLDRLDLKTKSAAEYDNFTFEYDANQNIKKITSKDGIISYDYDELNQLKSETLPDGSVISYDYDAAGNRKFKEKTIDGVTTTISYGYNGANQLTSVGSQAYEYDENGNLKSDGSRTFQFNEFNQLEGIKDLAGNSIAKYTYDEEGKRKSTTTTGGTVNYYYDGDKVLYETDSSNLVLREYTYDDYGHPLTMTTNGQPYYYLINHHGDVLALTDSNGEIVAEYTYDSWGNILTQNGPLAAENPYRYAGYRYDENTKLYYLLARYYNPDNGVFLSIDPVRGDLDNPLTQNGYSYVLNNPVMLEDPEGTTGRPNQKINSNGYFGTPKFGGSNGTKGTSNATKWTRANRMGEYEKWLDNGLKVNGKKYEINDHVINSLKKSGRKDIMPDQITRALKQKPTNGDRFSWIYTDPKTGVKVYVNEFKDIVGVQPGSFK